MSHPQGDRTDNEPPGVATLQNNSMHDVTAVPPPPTGHSPTEAPSTDHSARPLLPTCDPMDLMNRISGLYRLLDLISEDGSGGAVDMVVIDKLSVEVLANKLSPGSYVSMTKIDFQALGRHIIRPLGIYGSASAIVKFLGDIGCVDDKTSTLLNQRRDVASGISRPALRPGLYLLDARHIEQDLFHVIFWPETDTWDDNALSSVSRNRVTFMRYLTKLCSQVHCLISNEDGERIVWKHEHVSGHGEQDSDDENDTENFDRLFTFKVAVTNEQEETAIINEGFTLTDRSIALPDVEAVTQAGGSPAALHPMLVVGDQSQAILSVEYVPERPYTVPLDPAAVRWQFQQRLREPVQLDPDIDIESLKILIEYGLESESPHYLSWKQQFDLDRQRRGDDQIKQRRELSKSQREESRFTTAGLIQWLTDYAVRKYPALDRDAIFAQLLSEHSGHISDIRPDEAYDAVAARLVADPALVDVVMKEVSKLDLDSMDTHKLFQSVKKRLLSVDCLLRQVESLIGLILTPGDDFWAEYRNIIGIDGAAEERSSLRSRLAPMPPLGDWVLPRDPIGAGPSYRASFDRSPLSDRDYLEHLVQLKADRPAFAGVIGEIFVMAQQHIASRLSTALKGKLPSRLQHDMNERERKDLAAKCQQLADAEEERSWQSLKDQLVHGLRARNEQYVQI